MSTATPTTRLDVRLDSNRKNLIEQAAGLLGQTISAFTVSTLVREARDVVERFGTVSLSDRDRDAFLAALDNPPKPNARLKRALKAHGKLVRK
ncbi:MAG: DUF1778 domain-containing protein [Anaerohalosphaeraceae bacterium]|nr:DUF1778 domain-containing protein [Anaerohalosphaeraceae bacterium]